MTHQQISFRRKVIYLSVMAGLLVPLSFWGLPAKERSSPGQTPESFWQLLQGGRLLANLRYQHGLAQGNLGKIDPASETMKFGLSGLKGMAATRLWGQANEYKMKENWTAFAAVLDQLALLQPNFVSVWRFQGWNLSFNISAEQDDYRWRYFWVLRGINYLDDGQKFNDRETRLIWDEGWFTGHKIGRPDEYREFRRMFRAREMEHEVFALGEGGKSPWSDNVPSEGGDVRDNWLYAKPTFQEAIDKHDNQGVKLQGVSPELFCSEPAKCQMHYIEARNEEGRLDEFSQRQWKQALHEWLEFGRRPFTTFADKEPVRMSDFDPLHRERVVARRHLFGLGDTDEQGRSFRQQVFAKKVAELPEDDRAMFEKPIKDRTQAERFRVSVLTPQVSPTYEQIAKALPAQRQAEGLKLAAELAYIEHKIFRIANKMHVVNYSFWRTRCEMEASELGNAARRLLRDARGAARIDLTKAKEPYDKAFAKWREVLDAYPELIGDGGISDKLTEEFRRYARVLEKSNEKFDQSKFILKDVLEARPAIPPIGE